jgi:hypothetical protein
MKIKEFSELLERRINKTREVLDKKNAEYADGADDKLYNFKRAAKISGDTVKKTLAGMMLKHEVSIWDIIDGKRSFTEAMIDEKIGDMINYLILLEAVLKENMAENASTDTTSMTDTPSMTDTTGMTDTTDTTNKSLARCKTCAWSTFPINSFMCEKCLSLSNENTLLHTQYEPRKKQTP